MNKKNTNTIIVTILISLFFTTTLSVCPVKSKQGKVTRTSGADRYATAAHVAESNWTTTDNIVLVSGEGYADSISASVLAKTLDAPIILTTPAILNSDAEIAIELLKPKNIYLIGGTSSISQNIRDNLKILNYNLIELGGTDRYETNVKVAMQLVKLGVNPSNLLVVGGSGFSDALSVAPIAASKGEILLLANNDEDSIQPVIDFVKNNNSIVTVIGTRYVINDAIYNTLKANKRIEGGADRFQTNLNVLNEFKDALEYDKLYVASANPDAPDTLYADALVASVLAGKYTAPLVLINKDGTYTADNAIDYIENIFSQNTELYIIGGTDVISDSMLNNLERTIFKPTAE